MNAGIIVFLTLLTLIFSGCASERKARIAERERISKSSGFFCDFVNGDQYHDIDVQTNFQMANRCDSNKHFTITNYKNSSDIFGIVFCCNTKNANPVGAANASASANANAKKSEKAPVENVDPQVTPDEIK